MDYSSRNQAVHRVAKLAVAKNEGADGIAPKSVSLYPV
jgi:hypothetical protein